MIKYRIFLIVIILLVSGCATITGPTVNRDEVFKMQEALKVRALNYRLKQLSRVNNIAYKLITGVPQDEIKVRKGPDTFLGVYIIESDKYLKRLYNIGTKKKVPVVVSVINGSIADKAGIRPGDVLVAAEDVKFSSSRDFQQYMRRLVIGDPVELTISRDGRVQYIQLIVGSVPVNVPIIIVDAQEVNAAASSSAIYVTYGLINFADSDNEIAAVLSHELAHLVRGHVSKAQASSLISTLLSIPLIIAADKAAPGSGDLVAQAASVFAAGYSRDLEREADYFSVKFLHLAGFNPCVCATFHERFAIEIPQSMISNYLSTHPSSPERVLRIQKAIEELGAETCPEMDFYE